MRDLLVTGGAGFIGANFVRFWRECEPDARIVVLDALTYAGNRANLADVAGVALVEGDIRDTEAVIDLLRRHELAAIVHFAAETHVDRSIDGPDAFIETNVIGTHSLLKAAREVWLDGPHGVRPHRFHHISTDEVYGALGPDDPPFTESTPYAPNSPYSASKASSDHLVRAYHRTFGLQTTTSNCSNNYGAFQYPEKLIPLFLTGCLEGRSLPIYGNGSNVRDWLHVHDHCEGIARILRSGRPGETYNIGGGAELDNNTVVNAICDWVDRAFRQDPLLRERFPHAPAARGESGRSLKTYVTDRPGHDLRYAIDDRKIRHELGYAARRSFDDGLAETLSWYLANQGWWEPLQHSEPALARG